MTGEIIRRLIVSGRVQGVGFRAWVEEQATARDLRGWVRNRRDGSVEAVIAGKPDSVGEMIEACRRGPWLAKVADVQVTEAKENDLAQRHAADRFSQLPTV
jgi:acylphosphatase